jgi:hypothetical protein
MVEAMLDGVMNIDCVVHHHIDSEVMTDCNLLELVLDDVDAGEEIRKVFVHIPKGNRGSFAASKRYEVELMSSIM